MEPAAKRARAEAASEAEILRLVSQREAHREAKRYAESDAIREELRAIGVELYDKERTWKCVDGRQGVLVTGGHQVECFLTDQEIQSRITQREDARSAKDWSRADMLREDLRRNGVELVDGQKMWVSTDGRQGLYRGSMPPSALAMPTMMQGVGLLGSPLGSGVVGQLGGVLGSSTSLTTSMVGGGGGAPMSLSTVSIMALIQGRERARDGKDWQAADAIREDLRAHGVEVWDKDKNWKCNDGRHGRIP